MLVLLLLLGRNFYRATYGEVTVFLNQDCWEGKPFVSWVEIFCGVGYIQHVNYFF